MTINRQVLGEYLTNYYIYLETFVEELLKNMQKEVLLYKPLGMLMVKDYYKIVRILLNSTDKVYLKIIYIENKNYLEKVYLILNNNQSWYITKDIFKPEEIPKLMAKLQETHNSFVVASPYCLNNAIFPSHKWQINGLNGVILCYGALDELNQIIESFLAFASSNGNRIDDIKEEQIIRAIRLKD